MARLAGHALRFHKKSIDGSSKADALETNSGTDEVLGVVFKIDPAQKRQLDAAEGINGGYVEKAAEVTTAAGERMNVLLYQAERSAINDSLLPYSWYKQFVLDGAREHGLPTAYIAAIENQRSTVDPEKSRAEDNAVLLRERMWRVLWEDFYARALRLANGGKISDAVDDTVGWQLNGDKKQVGSAIPMDDLQLPEIYSGSPWRLGIPSGGRRGEWIAFVCGNPSIDPDQVHPTLGNWLTANRETPPFISAFDHRFSSPVRSTPVIHGRAASEPVYWKRGNPPTAVRQPTWEQLEALVADAVKAIGAEATHPLGDVAAIADAVPWKFRHWNPLPDAAKRALLTAGVRYLRWFLEGGAAGGRPPGIVVFLGSCARRASHMLFRDLGIEASVTRQPVQDLGRRSLFGGFETHVLTAPHPVDRGNLFGANRARILDALTRACS